MQRCELILQNTGRDYYGVLIYKIAEVFGKELPSVAVMEVSHCQCG